MQVSRWQKRKDMVEDVLDRFCGDTAQVRFEELTVSFGAVITIENQMLTITDGENTQRYSNVLGE